METLLQLLLFVGIFMCSAVLTFLSGGLIAVFIRAIKDNSRPEENVAVVLICAWVMALIMIGVIGIGEFSDSDISSEKIAIETTMEATK